MTDRIVSQQPLNLPVVLPPLVNVEIDAVDGSSGSASDSLVLPPVPVGPGRSGRA